ncbi:Glutathione synthase/RimK-type ligase, ATP-grasp superfamily [Modicisalibacter ilicicola DSM 19980]|uniref:Glutathione synthase/RimK-type ligase, ATP-grasp superfamily n=1 Tax=Modicisalibacter ilicicola DSM 19980 TaxID=1121942 RepID=A0A1M5BGN1_9GAMM|nr:RimK family protein [Halomonas ilicicola]SHF41611.1 Glutathione synthase/RimK-type ligase, ATP-grasp superfamily [Halomonas ilicicola DSM 19980]
MSPLRIVVDRLSDWRPYFPSDDLITAGEYLAQEANGPQDSATHVINLCSGLDYLETGYYVSLLAQARGQRVLPSVETLNQLSRKALVDLQLESLAPLMDELARRGALAGDAFHLRLMFGECLQPGLGKLARRLFDRLPCPLLEARFQRRQGLWRLARLKPLSLTSLSGEEQDLFAQALNRHSRRVWRTPKARRRYRYDLAILIDPGEALPPSNKSALKQFIRAGRKLGIDVSLITKRDESRLAEFDALFIRETTALDHHTYRMARRAEHEGLVVIDDPRSILRCTNKVYLHALLGAKGVPAPEGLLLHRDDLGRLPEKAAGLQFPMVLKIPDGAFSRGVVKIQSGDQLRQEAERLFDSSALLLLQEWLPTEFDWRIGVLDGKVLYASRYYMARGHWQIYDHSRGRTRSGGFTTHDPREVPKTVVKAALKATRLIGDGLYGVDIKQIGERVVVIEINDNPNLDAGVEDTVLGPALYARVMEVFLERMEARRRQAG